MLCTSGEVSDILPWNYIYGHTSFGQPAKTYIQQLCVDTEFRQEDAFANTGGWWENQRNPCNQHALIVGWLVVSFYGISTLFGSFNAKLNFKQFNLVKLEFLFTNSLMSKQFYFKKFSLALVYNLVLFDP